MRMLLGVAALLLLSSSSVHACPLQDVRASTWQQDQEYASSPLNPYIWYLSPCAVGFPNGQQACAIGSGFFGQWDIPSVDNGKCQQLQDTQTQTWLATQTSAGNGYQAEFSDTVTGNTGTVVAICDTSATNMQPYGNVVAKEIQGGYNYKLTFKSNAICGSNSTTTAPATTTSSPSPAPPSPTGFPANCASFSTCYDCTTSPSGECGFCSETKTCEKGNAHGPSGGGGTCSGSQWRWFPTQCKAQ